MPKLETKTPKSSVGRTECSTSPVIVGIDPSLTSTGIVILQGNEIIHQSAIKIPKGEDTYAGETLRLMAIVDAIECVVGDFLLPDLIVIEGLAFMARNTSALTQLAGLHHLLRSRFLSHAPLVIVAPSSLKKFITGKGNSQKDMLMLDTYKLYGLTFPDNDICDAHGLARVGLSVLSPETCINIGQKEVSTLVKKQYDITQRSDARELSIAQADVHPLLGRG